LEEEAVKTYNKFLSAIDEKQIPNTKAPNISIEYWGLPNDATLRDVVLIIRADEMDHRDVNHSMSDKFRNIKTLPFNEINIKPSDLYSMDITIKKDPHSTVTSTEELIKNARKDEKTE